jgi:hypothetical protein
MRSYIDQLERARDAVEAPEASGEAIAQEFERYLRAHPDEPGESAPDSAPGGSEEGADDEPGEMPGTR